MATSSKKAQINNSVPELTFWQKNQVFISGVASAIALSLQQFIAEPEINWKVIGMAALMAVASFIGNEWRGKGVTVAGFIGVAAYSFYSVQTTGNFTWNQFILMTIVGFLALIAPPPKNEAYEHSATIKQAKQEGQVIKKKIENTPPPQI